MNRCLTFGRLGVMLLSVLATQTCFGQANSASESKKVHSLPYSSATWKAMSAIRARKPLSVLTLTNKVSQDSILTVTDRINATYDIDGYFDGHCGFGARLGRSYLGSGSVVSVSFAWDESVKRTVISLYGTNATLAPAWERDMIKGLRETFGPESVQRGIEGQRDARNNISFLNEGTVLAIAKRAVTTNDTWVSQAEFETPKRQADGSWGVWVWRLPKQPGGHRLIVIDQEGRVTRYIRGY